MDAISYTAARANLAQTMKRVCADHEPLIITRNGEPARRLMDAVDSLEAGHGEEHVLAE